MLSLEWLARLWVLEKEIGAPNYIVGLGSGVLKNKEGMPTRASENVADRCLSLYRRYPETDAIIIIGGRVWKDPPFTDAELTHKRLLWVAQSTGHPPFSSDELIMLDGNNTHEQIQALRRFLADFPTKTVLIVCPRLQSRRLLAILKKEALIDRAGIETVDDGCQRHSPVETWRWSPARYLLREILAFAHHKILGWI